MIKIYRTTDRLPVEIGGMKFLVSPLTFEQKISLAGLTHIKNGEETFDTLRLTYMTLKYALKGLEGASYHDGTPFECTFDEDGTVSKKSLDEIAQVADLPELFKAISAMAVASQAAVNNDVESLKKPATVKKKVHSTSTGTVPMASKQSGERVVNNLR